jgi:hypothetical protein
VLGLVAVPAQQPQVRWKPQLDDDVIPASTGNAVSLRFSWVMAPGIGIAVSLAVVNREELFCILTTAHAPVSVVSKNRSFVANRLFFLPLQSVRSGFRFLTESTLVWFGLFFTRVAKICAALNAALRANSSSAASTQPSIAGSVLFFS